MTSDGEYLELAARAFEAVRAGDTAELVAALAAGVAVNLANQSGDTLVMLAAYHGHLAALEVLLERGADPNRLNDKAQSPLAGAVFKTSDDIVRVLLAAGADPAAGQPSAVDTARMFGRDELLALFEQTRE
ncbi:ankyrin repeat domain-containing protein [Actinokineospora sp. NBRC 105648]|uniref:ankyrin repeat domain-containing protein n=1 Tax=Actinokineospora sp. NBRC 105648 TaxID=3032206 RepID=UPI00249F9D8C|nr:ankyrin repeat domain-containing protein [Actinokineospora sp. NBRC 105648]GLZ39864.1 hypothetical protein Acsp05_34880 [Actinokineospora sp. NBRC 105648]